MTNSNEEQLMSSGENTSQCMEFGDIQSDMKCIVGFAIDGMEDMGRLDLKNLSASDLMKFHFANVGVAFTFYNWYARMNGFSARKSKVRRNKNKEIIQQRFVCYRQGFREEKFGNDKIRKREARADTRCGCDAKFSVHIDSVSQRWYVWDFNNVHNHRLLDEDFIGFLPGHRGMDDDDILQMKNFRKSGIRTSQAYGSFANHYGGYKNVTFLKQDMYNEVDKDRRSKGSDSRAALAFLRSLKNDDPAMFMRHTIDEQGRLEHLFWSDGRSQLDYSIFGDVLAFDATYKKNKYLCPLVVFSGVNHHNQTVVFATAIVANEVEDTYVWLLEQLMEVMKGKMPKSVITDGDLAMRNAIRRIFPDTHHRLCAWHLIRNVTCNVKNTRFTYLFKKCMLCDYEIVDFERKWNEMVKECGVEDSDWVLELYEKKDMWATAHIRGKFFGGFRTTSRCEGLNAQIGKYVNYQNNLFEFLQHYKQCIEYLRFKELEADFASLHGDRVLQTQFRYLEKSASNVYTKAIFLLFRTVLQKSSAVTVIGCKQTASCFIYSVTKYCRQGTEWSVSYWPVSMEIKCSCLRMESMGIPCEHIVGVMVYLNMVEIPSYLVLDRWTKNVKDSISCSKLVQGTGWDSMTICRYKALNQRSRDVNGLGCKSVEDYLDTMDVLNAHFERLKIKHGIQSEEVSNDANRKERFVRNPKVAKTKGRGGGRGTSRRQTKRRSVHCGFCGNVGHNKATCEVRRKVNGVDDEDETNNSVTDEDLYSEDDE